MNDYPDNLTVRPLTSWPGELTPANKRRWSPFSAKLSSTLDTLRVELKQRGAQQPILEVAIDANQFRIDGRPYARATAEHPGVVLSLPRTDVGPLRFACDHYVTWQENLRAIVLTMEALRAVDRYGVASRAEQYAGFRALPPAGKQPMSPQDAARYVVRYGYPDQAGEDFEHTVVQVMRHESSAATAYRLAAKSLHPDVGGSHEAFVELQEAREVLEAHHKAEAGA